jgi:hypothetical protein
VTTGLSRFVFFVPTIGEFLSPEFRRQKGVFKQRDLVLVVSTEDIATDGPDQAFLFIESARLSPVDIALWRQHLKGSCGCRALV